MAENGEEETSPSDSDDDLTSPSRNELSKAKARRNRANVVKHSKDQRDRKREYEAGLQSSSTLTGAIIQESTAHLKRKYEGIKLTRTTCFAKTNYLLQILFASSVFVGGVPVDFDQLIRDTSVIFDPHLTVTLPESNHIFSKPTRVELNRCIYSGLPDLMTFTEGFDAFCVSIAHLPFISDEQCSLTIASRLVVIATIDPSTFLFEEGMASVKFEVRTVNAVLCGGTGEFYYSGMMIVKCTSPNICDNVFGEVNVLPATESDVIAPDDESCRILSADVFYDAQEVHTKMVACFGLDAIQFHSDLLEGDSAILSGEVRITTSERLNRQPSSDALQPTTRFAVHSVDTVDQTIPSVDARRVEDRSLQFIALASEEISHTITTRCQHNLPNVIVVPFELHVKSELIGSFFEVKNTSSVVMEKLQTVFGHISPNRQTVLVVRIIPVPEGQTQSTETTSELSGNIALSPQRLLWSLSLIPVVDHTHDSLSVSLVTLCLRCVMRELDSFAQGDGNSASDLHSYVEAMSMRAGGDLNTQTVYVVCEFVTWILTISSEYTETNRQKIAAAGLERSSHLYVETSTSVDGIETVSGSQSSDAHTTSGSDSQPSAISTTSTTNTQDTLRSPLVVNSMSFEAVQSSVRQGRNSYHNYPHLFKLGGGDAHQCDHDLYEQIDDIPDVGGVDAFGDLLFRCGGGEVKRGNKQGALEVILCAVYTFFRAVRESHLLPLLEIERNRFTSTVDSTDGARNATALRRLIEMIQISRGVSHEDGDGETNG